MAIMMINKRRWQKVHDQGRTSGNNDGASWCRGPCIGKGGFASVYLATTKKSRTMMAVKSAESSASATLQKEREVLSNLQDFRHIIRCFGEEVTVGKSGEKVYNLLLEYASGGSLYDMIFNKTSCCGLPESEVRRYTRSILEAIKHVHDCGYAHLDIKSDNILLVPAMSTKSHGSTIYEAKLCDFGLAKKVNERKNDDDFNLRGTASYLSPEAVAEGFQGPPCDIWALGCVVLEMLTGLRARVREENWSIGTFYYKIGYELGTPMIPRHLSEEAKEFLRCCFAMKAEDRLTAVKLLELPFLSVVGPKPDKAIMNRFKRFCRVSVAPKFRTKKDGYGRIGVYL